VKTKAWRLCLEIDNTELFDGLRINEILALNDQTNSDEHNEYDDWVELYNSGPDTINIGGLYFTDDLNQADMWQIPTSSQVRQAFNPVGFCSSGPTVSLSRESCTLIFKLGGDGEEIGLAKKVGSTFVFIDTLVFSSQTTDVSFGRLPDGRDDLAYFLVPTPGYGNESTSISWDNPNPSNRGLPQAELSESV